MDRRGWTFVGLLAAALLIVACLPDDDSSINPPVPGGPPKDPDSVSRSGGNGRHGLDHKLRLFGIAPTTGPTAGGTNVLIVGFNFLQAGPVTEVLFGADPAASFVVLSNNKIDAVTPPHPRGLVTITVRNDIGEEASLADIYEFIAPPPACLTLTPMSGPDTGGTDVTIETANFFDDFTLNPPDVFFDGALAAVVPIDATTVLATTPPDPNPPAPPAIHPVDVEVVSQSGLESCIFPLGFTYVPPTGPCMTITPDRGDIAGGETVTITSNGPCLWDPSTTVTFGGVPATSIAIISQTELTCVTPPAANPGPVDVVATGVDAQGGPCTCTVQGGFDYISPSTACMRIVPNRGDIGGGSMVSIYSLGPCFWDNSTTVAFGPNMATILSMTPTQVDVITPAGPPGAGPVDVTVTGTDGQGLPCTCVEPNGYTYDSGCTITGITPNSGGTNGGDTCVITGSGFVQGVDVLFGPVFVDPATIVVDPSGTSITCTVPPAPFGGVVDLLVQGPTGASCGLPGAYTYVEPTGSPCTITSVIPDNGPPSGGTVVTITGIGFDANTGVLFGRRPATQVTFISMDVLEAVTPAVPPPPAPLIVDVVVAPENSPPCILQQGFTYR